MADNELHKKFSLKDSSEWLLLQELSARLSRRWARALPGLQIDQVEIHLKAAILEVELCQTFIVHQISQNLSQQEFELGQAALKKLCSLLDGLALHRSFRDNREDQKYANLRALIRFLDSTRGHINFVNGPNVKLFKLPNDADELDSCLQIVTDCNYALFTLPLLKPVARSSRTQREKAVWKRNEFRDQAINVINALFERLNCGSSHEVLLGLTEDIHEDSAPSTFHFMLSACPELEVWQTVVTHNKNLEPILPSPIPAISPVSDICAGLRRYAGTLKVLHFYFAKNDTCGLWQNPSLSRVVPSPRTSLHQLIKSGAFNGHIIALENGTSIRYTTKDKRELAVKLGYYLMYFFDADFASNKIYLFDTSSVEFPYLAFSSKFPSKEDSYSFQTGHPTLLSFTKLLLELYIGEIVELEISPDSNQNIVAWHKLAKNINDLQQDREDSHIAAIRNCLLVHHYLSRELEGRVGEDADLKIRKILYENVICSLELALDEATPRTQQRQRQRSPLPDLSGLGFQAHSIRSPLVEAAVEKEVKDAISLPTQNEMQPPLTDSGYASTRLTAERAYLQEQVGENEDAQTIYSIQPGETHSRKQTLISELATYIFHAIETFETDKETQKRIPEVLPELLKAFSLKIGHSRHTANIEMYRDAMVFIHKNRKEIAAQFTKIKKLDEEQEDRIDPEPVPWMDRINAWHPEAWNEENSIDLLPTEVDTLDQEQDALSSLQDIEAKIERNDETSFNIEAKDEHWIDTWRDFILNADDFTWLISKLRKECELATTTPDATQTLANSIMSSLPSLKIITKKKPSPSHSVIFELDWDITAFFETQQYTGPPEKALENVVTLTGSCSDAQAITCSQYLQQTWPLTGGAILRLVQQVLMNEEEQTCELPDGTIIKAITEGSKFIVKVEGISATIVEVAEQFGWLGAALRSSGQDNGLVYCTPIIKNVKTPPFSQPGLSFTSACMACTVSFELEKVPGAFPTTNGQCWHGIFNNPVIVKGYPIPRKHRWGTGLEIPLDMMAALAGSHRIDRFGDKVFIKGFSTMIIPVKQEKGIIYWHLMYKPNGDRMCYLDNVFEQEKEMVYLSLEKFRHVLGWCSEARFNGASASANYLVTHSKLGRPSATGALFNTSVSSGQLILKGSAFQAGLKDIPNHVRRSGHVTQLKWIRNKFFLLWDENDKRGWLINGASALLHLVRASLKHDSEGELKESVLFNNDDLKESATPFTAKSAIHVLSNDTNRKLQLFKEDNGELLKHRIDHFYNILEKFIDHQVRISGIDGQGLSHMPRNCLEGWDFEDLAKTNKESLNPYVADIGIKGKSWVDLTRAIQAVTLVGRGFGNIIESAQKDSCDEWTTLPTQQYYIAACISDLRDIIQVHDDHIRLGETTIWHTPTTIYGSCRCKDDLKERCEPVQSLFPSELSQKLRCCKQQIPVDDSGALIFGHNSNFPWIWKDSGYPQEGNIEECMPPSVGKNSESFSDSGLGLSENSSEPAISSLSTSRMTIKSVEPQRTPMSSGRFMFVSSRERKQSRSLSPTDRYDEGQTAESQNRPIRPMEPQGAFISDKRRRVPVVQQQSSRASSESPLREHKNSLISEAPGLSALTSLDQPKSRKDFEIALICALQIESDAVEALFDGYYDEDYAYGKAPGDPNAYTTGNMAGHNVVLVFMSGMGKVNSANAAAGVRMSFPNIKLGILVGICGGVPGGKDGNEEVLLGDVIISTALRQYDFGRQYDGRAVPRDTLEDNFSRPNMVLRSFLSKYSGLRGQITLRERTLLHLSNLCRQDNFQQSSYPGADKDILYRPDYRHKHRDPNICSVCAKCQSPNDEVCNVALESSCVELGCEDSMAVSRVRIEKAKVTRTVSSTGILKDIETRDARKPFIHFGTIACGDVVMKSGLRRDEIALRDKIIAFEMEGAGVWDTFPTVIVKSVCDYADSHKNKRWQSYAAATAAACSKAFLEEWKSY